MPAGQRSERTKDVCAPLNVVTILCDVQCVLTRRQKHYTAEKVDRINSKVMATVLVSLTHC